MKIIIVHVCSLCKILHTAPGETFYMHGFQADWMTVLRDSQYIHGWNINESVQRIAPFINMIKILIYYVSQTMWNLSILCILHVIFQLYVFLKSKLKPQTVPIFVLYMETYTYMFIICHNTVWITQKSFGWTENTLNIFCSPLIWMNNGFLHLLLFLMTDIWSCLHVNNSINKDSLTGSFLYFWLIFI